MKNGYNYAIIKENNPTFARESVLLENKYNPKKKYALISKMVHKDGSESITTIVYDNDLVGLHNRAKSFPSWYNYPMGVAKDMQGYLREV
jgi:hypothetical protein